MNRITFTSNQFEKDSLAVFERLLQGYSKANQTSIWNGRKEKLVEKLTHLPTAPFERKLMEFFDYYFLAMSEGIQEIIEKSLVIRSQMEDTQRFVHIDRSYYKLPFLPKQTYLKRITVLNHEHELCYMQVYKLKFSVKRLWQKIIRHSLKKKYTPCPCN